MSTNRQNSSPQTTEVKNNLRVLKRIHFKTQKYNKTRFNRNNLNPFFGGMAPKPPGNFVSD